MIRKRVFENIKNRRPHHAAPVFLCVYVSLFPGDMCTEGVETLVYVLIAAVDLAYIADDACAFCRHGGQQQCYTGPDIR